MIRLDDMRQVVAKCVYYTGFLLLTAFVITSVVSLYHLTDHTGEFELWLGSMMALFVVVLWGIMGLGLKGLRPEVVLKMVAFQLSVMSLGWIQIYPFITSLRCQSRFVGFWLSSISGMIVTFTYISDWCLQMMKRARVRA